MVIARLLSVLRRFLLVPPYIFIVSLLFAIMCSDSTLHAESAPRPLRLGALLSLSGGLEQWCGFIRQGIELAEHDSDKGSVSIFFEDDRSVEKTAAATAAHKLADVDKVDLLFSWSGSTLPAVLPIAQSARVPLLVGSFDSHVRKALPNAFGAFINYELLPREIARFLIEHEGHRKVALITAADDWSQGFERPFLEEVTRLGGEVVLQETIAPDEVDLRPIVLRLKKTGAEAVLAPLFGQALLSLIRERSNLHYSGILHVGDGMFEDDIKTAGNDAEGIFAVQLWSDSPKLKGLYKGRFGSDANPLQLGLVASGYDWVMHVQGAAAEIRRRGGAVTRETLKRELATFRSEGILGPQMYGSAPISSGETAMVVRGGRYVRVVE